MLLDFPFVVDFQWIAVLLSILMWPKLPVVIINNLGGVRFLNEAILSTFCPQDKFQGNFSDIYCIEEELRKEWVICSMGHEMGECECCSSRRRGQVTHWIFCGSILSVLVVWFYKVFHLENTGG